MGLVPLAEQKTKANLGSIEQVSFGGGKRAWLAA